MKLFLLRVPSWPIYLSIFVCAFVVRALVFHFYIQHEERYNQPDTPDYHFLGLQLAHGKGMTLSNGIPRFWRTPGYPAYLAAFFHYYASHNSSDVASTHAANLKALWIQICLCSLLPLILFALAQLLTGSLMLAYVAAFIALVHPGFVLASCFLLTDGIAQVLFALFLLYYFKNFLRQQCGCRYILAALVSLALFTWLRPMGQFIALVAIALLWLSRHTLQDKLKESFLFLLLFSVSVAPWYIRNYQLTGKIFFCPLFGLYFNVFNAPKIKSRVENIPLIEAHRQLQIEAIRETYKEMIELNKNNSPYIFVSEMIALKPAWPWISGYPGYFIYDWIVECLKTGFDLYSYQLVSLHNNCFKWDPLVEYLPEKVSEALYKKPLPFFFRLIAYLELLLNIILWLGIFAGTSTLFLDTTWREKYLRLWIACCVFIGTVCAQTGGFGYARLRLPIEPLIILLGLSFWFYWYQQKNVT